MFLFEIVLCLGVSDTEHLKLNTSDLVLIIDFTLITLSYSSKNNAITISYMHANAFAQLYSYIQAYT